MTEVCYQSKSHKKEESTIEKKFVREREKERERECERERERENEIQVERERK